MDLIIPTSDPTEVELELPPGWPEAEAPPSSFLSVDIDMSMEGSDTTETEHTLSTNSASGSNSISGWSTEDFTWDPEFLSILSEGKPLSASPPRFSKHGRLRLRLPRTALNSEPKQRKYERNFRTVSTQTEPNETEDQSTINELELSYSRSQGVSPASSQLVSESFPGQLYTPVESLPVIFGQPSQSDNHSPSTSSRLSSGDVSSLVDLIAALHQQNNTMSTMVAQQRGHLEDVLALLGYDLAPAN